jgi:hypothetical protein
MSKLDTLQGHERGSRLLHWIPLLRSVVAEQQGMVDPQDRHLRWRRAKSLQAPNDDWFRFNGRMVECDYHPTWRNELIAVSTIDMLGALSVAGRRPAIAYRTPGCADAMIGVRELRPKDIFLCRMDRTGQPQGDEGEYMGVVVRDTGAERETAIGVADSKGRIFESLPTVLLRTLVEASVPAGLYRV